MYAVLTLGLLAAAPAAPPLRLATGTFTFVGIKDELRTFVPEHLASRMRSAELTVVTPSEIASLIGRERQRALLGCNEESETCLAELAGALGVDGVLMGELAAVGDVIQLNLKVLSEAGKPLASWSRRVDGERRLLDALDEGAAAIAAQVMIATGRKQAPVVPQVNARSWWWLPSAAGLAVGAAGGVLLGFARRDHELLTIPGPERLTDQAAQKLSDEGEIVQTLGFVGVGVGAAALVAGAGLLIFGAPPPLTPSVAVTGQGAVLSLGGRFP